MIRRVIKWLSETWHTELILSFLMLLHMAYIVLFNGGIPAIAVGAILYFCFVALVGSGRGWRQNKESLRHWYFYGVNGFMWCSVIVFTANLWTKVIYWMRSRSHIEEMYTWAHLQIAGVALLAVWVISLRMQSRINASKE